MKKFIPFLAISLLCIVAVCAAFFLIDHKRPAISVNDTPTLACDLSFDDLMNFANAEDDKELKSFFIEEKSLYQIAENGYLTYIAIDENNNVTRKQVYINSDPAIKTYRIELLKPLQFQVNEPVVAEDYAVLKNGCGWTINDPLFIEGLDSEHIGIYDIEIFSRKHSSVERIKDVAEVDDFRSPKIILNTDAITITSQRVYTDEYFLDLIQEVRDDMDNNLIDQVICDWREALNAYESGYIDISGTRTVSYSVNDSDGNSGQAQISVRINVPVIVEEVTEGE